MLVGAIEAIEFDEIRGWVRSTEDSDDQPLVEVFVGGRLRGSATANLPRSDGAPNGQDNDGYGFRIGFSRPLAAVDLSGMEIYATSAAGERKLIPAVGEVAAGQRATPLQPDDESPPQSLRGNGGSRPAHLIDTVRALQRELAEACATLEQSIWDFEAAPHEDEESSRVRREAAEREADTLRGELAAASEAIERAQASAAAAEAVIRFMAAGLRELSADNAAVAQDSRTADPVPPEGDDEADEPAPEFAEYWLPDPLREYVMDRFGDDAVPFLREMMAIISRHEARPADFVHSYDCRALVRRLRRLAGEPDLERPVDISIVIPVYNQLVYTLTCLLSILAAPTRHRFEILVADDASNDGTDKILPRIGGRVRHIRHSENLGFLLNCNLTNLQARGRWIVLLNNDVIALPGWLDELVATFLADDRIGLAGSKLLNADGSLQEAGGIFWNDGSAWNFGRGQNPRLPEFNYVKEVDYCSAAAVAVPRSVWRELGGFDLTFVPAYCEDSDLAFRVRASGRKVVYNPFAEIIHHEGRSHGRDTSSGFKAYQVKNMVKLVERWGEVLRAEHYPDAERVFAARDRSRNRPHILFIDHYVPQWDQDAGSRTIYQYLRFFLDHGFQISFWPDNLYEDPVYTKPLQQLGIEVLYSSHYLGRFDEWIAGNGATIDYVLLSRAWVALNYIDSVRAHTRAKVLFYGHDLAWKRLEMEYAVTHDPAILAEAEMASRTEDRMCEGADLILYPTAEECALIRQRFPGRNVAEIPGFSYDEALIRETRARLDAAAPREPHHLLFVGGFAHRPNGDAVIWFAKEILPLLHRQDARFRLTVVGSNPPDEIRALEGPAVRVTGRIDDDALTELYGAVGAAVVPLRFGAGIKGKVIEAFALGTPVVSTTTGLQGIADGQRLALCADDAAGFAARVVEAVSDPAGSIQRARQALDFVARHYSQAAIFDSLSPHVTSLRKAAVERAPTDTIAAASRATATIPPNRRRYAAARGA